MCGSESPARNIRRVASGDQQFDSATAVVAERPFTFVALFVLVVLLVVFGIFLWKNIFHEVRQGLDGRLGIWTVCFQR